MGKETFMNMLIAVYYIFLNNFFQSLAVIDICTVEFKRPILKCSNLFVMISVSPQNFPIRQCLLLLPCIHFSSATLLFQELVDEDYGQLLTIIYSSICACRWNMKGKKSEGWSVTWERYFFDQGCQPVLFFRLPYLLCPLALLWLRGCRWILPLLIRLWWCHRLLLFSHRPTTKAEKPHPLLFPLGTWRVLCRLPVRPATDTADPRAATCTSEEVAAQEVLAGAASVRRAQ